MGYPTRAALPNRTTRKRQNMKTKSFRGLASSLLLNLGLARAASKLDPVASGQTTQATVAGSLVSMPCQMGEMAPMLSMPCSTPVE